MLLLTVTVDVIFCYNCVKYEVTLVIYITVIRNVLKIYLLNIYH